MAERLTEKIFDETGKQQDIYEWSSASSLECNRKLGELEDIMERLGINFVEDLEDEIKSLRVDKYVYKKDRDTWKKACELACRYLEATPFKEKSDDAVKYLTNYYYQQAKNGGK